MTEAVAIIGIGCRFPGAATPAEFWRLLAGGIDAIREVPPERWSISEWYDPDLLVPGRTNTRWGGFLDQIDCFDPKPFSLSPREAARMDPQQRLLLEVAWEALEDAGIPPEKLAGTATGVFAGLGVPEYFVAQLQEPNKVDRFTLTGCFPCIAANRVSYVFDLRGPSMTIDTACSSSLVAVHLACQSIRSGESTLAFAGGANLLLSPVTTVGLTKFNAMSPTGRCRAFDAAADGYVRGEGAGIVVLKLLSQALHDGDRIYAAIRGSAINQDGKTNGLTAPNRFSQEQVLETAYRVADTPPGDVQYVETHGTGTPLGDPIELKALAAVLSKGRPADRPCHIGSVKTNIGHLEAAAGIASLIKVALALQHGELPPTLHFRRLNPHVAADDLPVVIQQAHSAWPDHEGPRLAGVSSFGFGGSNSHVVVQEVARSSRPARAPQDDPYCLAVSAAQPEALRALAQAYAHWLAEAPDDLLNICYTAATGRSQQTYRLCVLGHDQAELRQKLNDWLAAKTGPGIWTGQRPLNAHKRAAFCFQSQAEPMLGDLLAEMRADPAMEGADTGGDETFRLADGIAPHETLAAQFMGQYLIARRWLLWGVKPAAVLGSGIGALGAACIAQGLTFDAALALAKAADSLDYASPEAARRQQLEKFMPPLSAAAGRIDAFDANTGNPLAAPSLLYNLLSAKAARLEDSSAELAAGNGIDLMLQIGPGATLFELAPGRDARPLVPGQEPAPLRGESRPWHMLATLFTLGFDPSWAAVYRRHACQRVRLPSYPFQRQRLWLDDDRLPTRSGSRIL